MAANTQPIFPKTPRNWILPDLIAANNTLDLTSGTSYLLMTAEVNGSKIDKIRVKANPSQNTAATVMRIWVNNGGALGTSGNSSMVGELHIPATVASATSALPDNEYVLGLPIQAGYKIYLTFGTAPGGSGEFMATGFGGDY